MMYEKGCVSMKQKRIKSKVVWLAVVSQVVIILTATGVIPIGDIDMVKIIALSVIEVLTLFGILNDPTSKNHF